MSENPLKITAVTPEQAASALSAAAHRKITAEQVRQIAERGGLLRPDGTLSLIDYTAYLASEDHRG